MATYKLKNKKTGKVYALKKKPTRRYNKRKVA